MEDSGQQILSDINTRIRDLEDKQRLLKERVFLIGDTLVEERSKTFLDIQEIKKTMLKMKEEQLKMKEMLQRVLEQIDNLARKEEFLMLQRQFDMFRK